MASLKDLVPELQDAANQLFEVATQSGLRPRVTSVRRGIIKQAQLYELRQFGQWPYPVAPPGRSAHNYGWAFDMVVDPYEALGELGALWQSWGGTYGGVADRVHFEAPGASAWLRQASYWDVVEQMTQSAMIPPGGITSYLAELIGMPPGLSGTLG